MRFFLWSIIAALKLSIKNKFSIKK